MRTPTLPLLGALAIVFAAACSESATSRLTAPESISMSKSGDQAQNGAQSDNSDDHGKITICHAAGRAGTTHYVEITVSTNASYAHLGDHGTQAAGHEEDYRVNKGEGCGSGGSFHKTLVGVMTIVGGVMMDDPAFVLGGAVTIPAGETRWLEYRLDYSLPVGVTGVVTENQYNVCHTIGMTVNQVGTGAIGCSINYGGANPAGTVPANFWVGTSDPTGDVSWTGLTGTGSIFVPIDLHNGGVDCGKRGFQNTATLNRTPGTPLSASTLTDIIFLPPSGHTCPTP
jgi:hypothetical protein